MYTFLDSLFDKEFRSSRRNLPSPPKKKTEYHGVATAVGKLSKRLHSIEQALTSTVEDEKTPTVKVPIPDDVVTTPIIAPPPTHTVTVPPEPKKEDPIAT